MKGAVFVLCGALWLGFTFSAQAASFDCAKARTAVEKMICADAELSKLDEKMAAAYAKALPQSPDADYTTKQQKHWLRERNQCRSTDCLQQQYRLRLEELNRVIALVPLADTQESHVFKSEADKVLFMRDIVRRQDFVPTSISMDGETPFCAVFRRDFVAGRGIEAVEPLFTTTNANDQRFSKLNQCVQYWGTTDKEEPEYALWGTDYAVIDPTAVPHAAAPPYRYYTIQPGGSTATDTTMILYREPAKLNEYRPWTRADKAGYLLVNTSDCVVKSGVSAINRRPGTPGSSVCSPPFKCDPALGKLYMFSALIRYKGKLLAVSIAPNLTVSTTPGQYNHALPPNVERKKEVVSYDFWGWIISMGKQEERKPLCPYQSRYGAKLFCEHVTIKALIDGCRKYNLSNK